MTTYLDNCSPWRHQISTSTPSLYQLHQFGYFPLYLVFSSFCQSDGVSSLWVQHSVWIILLGKQQVVQCDSWMPRQIEAGPYCTAGQTCVFKQGTTNQIHPHGSKKVTPLKHIKLVVKQKVLLYCYNDFWSKSPIRAALLSLQSHSGAAQGLAVPLHCALWRVVSFCAQLSSFNHNTGISDIDGDKQDPLVIWWWFSRRRWNTRPGEAGLSSAPWCPTARPARHVPTDDCETGKGDTCWAACLGTAQLQGKPYKTGTFDYIFKSCKTYTLQNPWALLWQSPRGNFPLHELCVSSTERCGCASVSHPPWPRSWKGSRCSQQPARLRPAGHQELFPAALWVPGAGLSLLTGVSCARGSAGSLCCPRGLLGKADGNVDVGSTVLLEVFPSLLLIVLPADPAFLTVHVLHCPVPSPVPGIQDRAGSKANLDGRKTEQQCQFSRASGKGSPFTLVTVVYNIQNWISEIWADYLGRVMLGGGSSVFSPCYQFLSNQFANFQPNMLLCAWSFSRSSFHNFLFPTHYAVFTKSNWIFA